MFIPILIALAFIAIIVGGLGAVGSLTVATRGNRITYANTGSAIAAGDMVTLRSGTSGMVGIAITDIAATTGTGELCIGGGDEREFKTTNKASGEAWTAGTILYTDGTSITSTNTTTYTRVGVASRAAASADTTGYFILNG